MNGYIKLASGFGVDMHYFVGLGDNIQQIIEIYQHQHIILFAQKKATHHNDVYGLIYTKKLQYLQEFIKKVLVCIVTCSRSQVEGSCIPLIDSFYNLTILGNF